MLLHLLFLFIPIYAYSDEDDILFYVNIHDDVEELNYLIISSEDEQNQEVEE